ncbi:AAA domain-containing protein [Paenibacillus sp. JJ-223]|uniref:AAA domain-containing protein n=1 Tax=Paenibacillus sp. JJ-223 TaxID=2905647 RepID=UPI001F262081|nr:AAA domain-containing protein [Paenibacillus sp. JJ-223]
MENSLSQVEGELFSDEILSDPTRLEQLVQQKRRRDIFKKITSYPDINDHLEIGRYRKDELDSQIELVVSGNKSVEEFLTWLSFKYKDNRANSEKFISNLLNDAITICYPLLKKTTKKETSTKPLITFIGRIEEEKLKIEQFYINHESLGIVVAWLTNNSTFEVGEIEKANLLELMNANDYSQQQDMHEILNIFSTELKRKYQKDLNNFKSYEGWQMPAQVFVTFEMLEEMKRPIFQKEIERILELTTDEFPLPELLNTYLTGGQNTTAYIKENAGLSFHYGSYTDQYPINEKQWHVIEAINDHSLLSVNGPPGTGKSTLLKEVFADNMVMKAKTLTDLWEKPWEKIKERGKELYRIPFEVDNRTFSMVLTSTNNKAVDNIGLELLKEVSYFTDFLKQKTEGEETKGFFCARLGNATNKMAFTTEFVPEFIEGLEEAKTQNMDETAKGQFIAAYQELEHIHKDIEKWAAAKEELIRFYASQGRVLNDPATDLSSYQLELEIKSGQLNTIKNSILSLKSVIHERKQKIRDLEVQIESTVLDLSEYTELIKEGYDTLEKFRAWKKNAWLKWLLPKRKAFFIQYPSENYIENRLIKKKENEEEELRATLLLKRSEQDHQRAEIVILKDNLHELEQQQTNCNEAIQFIGQFIGKLETFLSLDKEIAVKWGFEDISQYNAFAFASDRVVLEKRYELFQHSLRVTEQYVKLHAEEVLHNLKMVCQGMWFQPFYSEGNKRDQEFNKGIRALWNTVFLCFPVVTSTLHSFGERTFQLLPGLIDTLLVDEAGQIMPHYLSSPLYRSQRAVIVGDIEQLEPVRLLKTNVVEEIPGIPEEHHEQICVQRNSAQSYIDRNSDIYEWDHRGKRKGLILTEHRRCEKSIMEFSNQHVYGGILTIVNQDNHDKLFGNNLVAIDVRGLKNIRTHTNMSEIKVCQRLVDIYVEQKGMSKKDIGIITPFTKQKDKLQKEIPGVDIGTVHAFQGQEKKIIIFSSVIDNSKQTGIASFVGGSTNLLNVALSRAKEQFVLVGNMEVISELKQNHLKNVFEIIQKSGVCISPLEESFHTIAEDMDAMAFSLYIDSSEGSQELLDPFSVYLREHLPERLILNPRDHYLLLMEALRHANKSIVIFSPWIMSYIVNDEFVSLVQAAMSRQVEVRIGFGYQGGKGIDLGNIPGIVKRDNSYGDYDKNVKSVSTLKEVMGESLKYIPPIHSKILLVDDRYLFLGSHNWLSKLGKHKRDEISCLVTEDRMIKYLQERYIQEKLK